MLEVRRTKSRTSSSRIPVVRFQKVDIFLDHFLLWKQFLCRKKHEIPKKRRHDAEKVHVGEKKYRFAADKSCSLRDEVLCKHGSKSNQTNRKKQREQLKMPKSIRMHK